MNKEYAEVYNSNKYGKRYEVLKAFNDYELRYDTKNKKYEIIDELPVPLDY